MHHIERSHAFDVGRRNLALAVAATGLGLAVPPMFARALPKRGIGVNCFNLFYGRLLKPVVAPASQRLRPLADLGIPFVRFAASPVWPLEWKRLYFNAKDRYFDVLDEVFRAAEDLDIKVVPTMIWYPAAISDLLGESVSAWLVESSKSRAFMRQYVAELTDRYGHSRSLLAWEFANEFNAYANLPNATRWWPRVSVEMGTPARRTQADLLTSNGCSEAFAAFAAAVKRHSPGAWVSSGSDLPLFNSENLLGERSEPDSESQFTNALRRLAPGDCDLLSIHLYPNKLQRFSFDGKRPDMSKLIATFTKTCRDMAKSSFIGEFGQQDASTAAEGKRKFDSFLRDIIDGGVDYAALWVYDFAPQESEWSVSPQNHRAWMLRAIEVANRSIR